MSPPTSSTILNMSRGGGDDCFSLEHILAISKTTFCTSLFCVSTNKKNLDFKILLIFYDQFSVSIVDYTKKLVT